MVFATNTNSHLAISKEVRGNISAHPHPLLRKTFHRGEGRGLASSDKPNPFSKMFVFRH